MALSSKRVIYMGSNTVEKYEEDTGKWCAAGARGKRSKKLAAKMRKKLFDKYPGSYDVPIELHINSLISKPHAGGCRNRTWNVTDSVEGVAQRRRCGMHAR